MNTVLSGGGPVVGGFDSGPGGGFGGGFAGGLAGHAFDAGILPFVLVLILGLAVGSFLNTVIHRLPLMHAVRWRRELRIALHLRPEPKAAYNLARPRSRCPHCGHVIRWHHNIPVASFFMLRGRCADCGGRIAYRYPLVEAVGGLIAVAAVAVFGYGTMALAAAGFLWALLALSVIDWDTGTLPDEITLPLAWAGLLVAAWLFDARTDLRDAVIGAAAGYVMLWAVYWCFKLITGREGMGYGDFKLLAAIGAWLGWQALSVVVLIAALSGIAYAVMRHLQGERGPIPFGPFLSLGGATVMLLGHERFLFL